MAVLEVRAGRVRAARRLANALDAQLIVDTVPVGAAQRTAHTSRTLGSGWTLQIAATVLERYAAQQRITGRPRAARTNGQMVLGDTIGARPTGTLQRARIDALVTDAGPRRVTFIRRRTFDLPAALLRITTCSLGTFALRSITDRCTACVLTASAPFAARIVTTALHALRTRRTILVGDAFVGVRLATGGSTARITHQPGWTGTEIVSG